MTPNVNICFISELIFEIGSNPFACHFIEIRIIINCSFDYFSIFNVYPMFSDMSYELI